MIEYVRRMPRPTTAREMFVLSAGILGVGARRAGLLFSDPSLVPDSVLQASVLRVDTEGVVKNIVMGMANKRAVSLERYKTPTDIDWFVFAPAIAAMDSGEYWYIARDLAGHPAVFGLYNRKTRKITIGNEELKAIGLAGFVTLGQMMEASFGPERRVVRNNSK